MGPGRDVVSTANNLVLDHSEVHSPGKVLANNNRHLLLSNLES